MLMAGCCCCGAREEGAFGFSNERSLVYCASTLSWGGACSWGAPLPLVMKLLLKRCRAETGCRLNFARWGRNAFIRASGYHSPASFHKDDGPVTDPVRGGELWPIWSTGGSQRPICALNNC